MDKTRSSDNTNSDIAIGLRQIREDFEELFYLSNSLGERLNKMASIQQKKAVCLPASALKALEPFYVLLSKRITHIQNDIQVYIKRVDQQKNARVYKNLCEKKYQYYNTLRTLYSLYGAIRTSLDFQSPSFSSSATSEAGLMAQTIKASLNDYKRDQHRDASEFEALFLREYIDAPLKGCVRVYATCSGMAAFTTIITYLACHRHIDGPILLGKSTYFECNKIVQDTFRDVHVVDESDTKLLLMAIRDIQPRVVFLDTVTNSPQMAIPDTLLVIEALKNLPHETFIVIDNSSAGILFQPFSRWVPTVGKLSVLVFESLNKFYQFGLDRATGGIIYAAGKGVDVLFDYREHLGTIIPDASVHMIPPPKKKFLARRMKRIEHNAVQIARDLSEVCNTHKSKIRSICSPGLKTHPQYYRSKSYGFSGPFLTLDFYPKYQTVSWYKRFVAKAIALARQRSVRLIGGTSFGLTTTRIYLTATRTTMTTPFVRISPGTETDGERKEITQVFKETIVSL